MQVYTNREGSEQESRASAASTRGSRIQMEMRMKEGRRRRAVMRNREIEDMEE